MRTAKRRRKVVNMKVDAELWSVMKRYTKLADITLVEAVEDALRLYLKEHVNVPLSH
jgi:hypothetical protein